MPRKANWTSAESANLARAWVSTWDDPRKGADQSAKQFMQKVHENFVNLDKEANPERKEDARRTLKSIINQ